MASLRVGSLFESQKASSPLKLSVAASARAASTLSNSASCVREAVPTKTMESVERVLGAGHTGIVGCY